MSADVLDEWSDAPFDHEPVAGRTGPFPHRSFLETWWDHIGRLDRLAIVAAGDGTLPLRLRDETVLFVGDWDLTDYHTPLGDPAACVAVAAAVFSGHRFSFDSLPEEAAAARGRSRGDHRLGGLRKKDRHEVRRKRRNFIDALGEPQLERRSDNAALAHFFELHRAASGEKGSFMRPEREAFFADLVRRTGATVELLDAGDDVLAAAFGWADDDGYDLYNSAYSRAAAAHSPGIVLLATMIEALIADGFERLDLLKGDEPYKYRMGAAPRQLYRIEGSFA